ncbi:hypothetical protein AAMO2058_001197100 [Amorphochlora amoebiformis]
MRNDQGPQTQQVTRSGSAQLDLGEQHSSETLQRLQKQYRNLSHATATETDKDDKHTAAMRASLDVLRTEITRLSNMKLHANPSDNSAHPMSTSGRANSITRTSTTSKNSHLRTTCASTIDLKTFGLPPLPQSSPDAVLLKCGKLIDRQLHNLARIREGFLEYARCIASMPMCANRLGNQLSQLYDGATPEDRELVMKGVSAAVEQFSPGGFVDQEVLGEIDKWSNELLDIKRRILEVEKVRRKFLSAQHAILKSEVRGQESLDNLTNQARAYASLEKDLRIRVFKAVHSRHHRMDTCFTNIMKAQVGFFSSAYGSSG